MKAYQRSGTTAMSYVHHLPLFRPGAALAVLLLLVAAPQAARAQSDWVFCAEEGQTCQVSGEAMVRFGSEGRYTFRVTRNHQPCDVGAFGSDPAPGRRKQCDVSVKWRGDPRYRGWRDAGANAGDGHWRHCAVEGDVCVVNGSARVRFGVQGRYAMRQVTGRSPCAISAFGDPAPGVPKTCEVEDTSGWVLCANEGDMCWVPGSARVRYGAEGQYAERSASQSIACNNALFGDPRPGVAKQCEYKLGAGAAGPGALPARGLPWEPCAREGDRCNFRGPGMVRYGAAGRYVYQEAQSGLQCGNETFGGDPAPGVDKQCELLRMGR